MWKKNIKWTSLSLLCTAGTLWIGGNAFGAAVYPLDKIDFVNDGHNTRIYLHTGSIVPVKTVTVSDNKLVLDIDQVSTQQTIHTNFSDAGNVSNVILQPLSDSQIRMIIRGEDLGQPSISFKEIDKNGAGNNPDSMSAPKTDAAPNAPLTLPNNNAMLSNEAKQAIHSLNPFEDKSAKAEPPAAAGTSAAPTTGDPVKTTAEQHPENQRFISEDIHPQNIKADDNQQASMKTLLNKYINQHGDIKTKSSNGNHTDDSAPWDGWPIGLLINGALLISLFIGFGIFIRKKLTFLAAQENPDAMAAANKQTARDTLKSRGKNRFSDLVAAHQQQLAQAEIHTEIIKNEIIQDEIIYDEIIPETLAPQMQAPPSRASEPARTFKTAPARPEVKKAAPVRQNAPIGLSGLMQANSKPNSKQNEAAPTQEATPGQKGAGFSKVIQQRAIQTQQPAAPKIAPQPPAAKKQVVNQYQKQSQLPPRPAANRPLPSELIQTEVKRSAETKRQIEQAQFPKVSRQELQAASGQPAKPNLLDVLKAAERKDPIKNNRNTTVSAPAKPASASAGKTRKGASGGVLPDNPEVLDFLRSVADLMEKDGNATVAQSINRHLNPNKK